MRPSKAALICAVLLLGSAVRADENISLLLGRTQPLVDGGLGLATKPGVGVGLEYIHQYSWVIGLGVAGDYLPFKPKTVAYSNASVETTAKASTLCGVFKISPFYGSKWEPFAIGGMGVNSFFEDQTVKPNPGYVWVDTRTSEKRTVVKTSSTDLAYFFGGGFDTSISDKGFFAGLEARWHYFNISEDQFGKRLAKAFTLMARVGLRLDD